jgi:hypothetical protein
MGTSQLLLGVQDYRLREPKIGPAGRLFPSFVHKLPIAVLPCSTTLVVCRWDQQRTVGYLCPFSAPVGHYQWNHAMRGGRTADRRMLQEGTAGSGECRSLEECCQGAVLATSDNLSKNYNSIFHHPPVCLCHVVLNHERAAGFSLA